MSTLYERFPGLIHDLYQVNLIPLVIGAIGRGSKQEAIDYCVQDLKEHGFEEWHRCLNFYRELYGYTLDPSACITCREVKV